MRRQLVHDLNEEITNQQYEGFTAGDNEPEIFVKSFIDNHRWYLPIPTSAKAYLSSTVQDLASQVADQTYPY